MKENKHETLKAVILLFVGAVAYSIIGDINTLFLAHIWPVTIHFGDFSFNNFLFIFVAVLSTIIIGIILTALCFAFLFSAIANAFNYWVTPKEKRQWGKTRWFEYPIGYLFVAATWLAGLFMPLFLRKQAPKIEPLPPFPNADNSKGQTKGAGQVGPTP